MDWFLYDIGLRHERVKASSLDIWMYRYQLFCLDEYIQLKKSLNSFMTEVPVVYRIVSSPMIYSAG